MKRILSIETASEFCSVALSQGDELISRTIGVPQQHSLSILPMIEDLLAQGQITLKMLDAIAVGNGPGSFTGVRLALSVAQGLSFGLALPCIPISTLAILAYGAKQAAQQRGMDLIMPIMDARMQEVYAGLYILEKDELKALIADSVIKPNEIKKPTLAGQNIENIIAIGTGWQLYETELQDALELIPVYSLPKAIPQASHLAQLAQLAFEKGEFCKPEECMPSYCRNKVVF